MLALNDVFYLLVRLCDRKDMIHPWIYDRCREVQKGPNDHLDLWARDHYKSTIITFGMTMQDILANPEVNICILSHKADQAEAFLVQIQREFTLNGTLKSLFPEVLYSNPETQAPLWSAGGLVVKRKSNSPAPTVLASGLVDGMPTGMHFSHLVYDDIVTPKSVTNPEQIKKTTEMYRLSDNLGSGDRTIKRLIGTRYNLHDTYSVILDDGSITGRIHPATSDGTTDTSKSVLLPPHALEKKRRTQGPYVFSAQMLLNPAADTIAGFDEKWPLYWPAVHFKNLNRIILVDPSSGKARKVGNVVKNDYTCMIVVGRGRDDNRYIIDIIRDRLTLTGRKNMLFSLVDAYQVKDVFYEETGYAADVEYILEKQTEENYRFNITALSVSGLKKSDRIRSLVPRFESGQIYLPERIIRTDYEGKAFDVIKVFLEEEYKIFPNLSHDDMLDTMSQMEHPDVLRSWTKPLSIETPIAQRIKREQRQALRKNAGWGAL